MRRQIVIYKAKPETADENQRMLEKVFEELRAKQPRDLRYLSARLSDGTFVHIAAAVSLRTFMRLPVAQRSSVILTDVLGYSLDEIADVTATTLPAIKAALHRGRSRLRALADEPEDRPAPVLSAAERTRLTRYIDHFNAREFDALRNLLADEVKLDLVNRTRLQGRGQVTNYFSNYERAQHWHFVEGLVEGRPAILVHEPGKPGIFNYFVLLGWQGQSIATIRDFLYAGYVMEEAEVQPFV